MIPKLGKDSTLVGSNRPVSLITIFIKIFEKLILKNTRSYHIYHKLAFRERHSSMEWVHGIVHVRSKAEK